jgi:outer membrane receptor protein involved in Fe transport
MIVIDNRTKSLPLLGVIAIVSSYLPVQAGAEDQTSAPPGESGQLETILVTANKRSEDVKNVPTSISVLSGTQLQEQQISSYDDLSRAVPGVSFQTFNGLGAETINIRSISSAVGSATVGLYYDETPITLNNASGTAQPEIFDLDRIEVLRGPQGTLYGASSEGGTIRFITKQPDLSETTVDFGSELSGTEHGGINYDERAVLNYPIVPGVLAIRGGVEYGDQSGWIDWYNHATGALLAANPLAADLTPTTLKQSGVNDVRSEVFKLAATYQPSPDLTITPSFYYQRQKQSDGPEFFLNEGLYQETRGTPEFARDTTIIPSLKVDVGLDFADLTSITSYFWRQFNHNGDGTYYDSGAVVAYFIDPATNVFTPQQIAAGNTVLGTLPSTETEDETNAVVSEEIRLASKPQAETGLPLSWVAGIFYENDTDRLNHLESSPGWDSGFESVFGFNPDNLLTPSGQINPIGVPGSPTLWDGDKMDVYISKRGIAQYAAFGQADFDIMPALHASAGVRYQYTPQTYQVFEGGWWNAGVPAHSSSTVTDYALTPKFTVTYDLSDQANIYAQAAKGFRNGGNNVPVPASVCGAYYHLLGITAEPEAFNADKLWSYELGTKGQILDNSLSFDADVYYIQWSNVQQEVEIPVCAYQFVTNVGNSDAEGSELQAHYRVREVPGLTINVTGNVQHAVIVSTTDAAAAAVGEKLLFSPDWTATAGFNYVQNITDDVAAYVRADYDWVGRSHGDFNRSALDYTDKQYGVINARIGVDTGAFEVSLFAKNLLDNQQIIKHPNVDGVQEAYTLTPLTVGLNVTAHFAAATQSPEPAAAPVPPPAPAVPPPAPVAEAKRSFQVFFDFDKSTITEAAAKVIHAAADAVKAGNVVQIAVTGHTDTVGTASYNQGLSERRAGAVKQQLVTDGVATGDITTTGVGKTGLLVPTADGVREPQNRRAEIVLQ